MTLIFALDFGGTVLAAAVVKVVSRNWLGYERCLSPPNADANTDLDLMRRVHSLLQSAWQVAPGAMNNYQARNYQAGNEQLSQIN